jgi:putative membrane protein
MMMGLGWMGMVGMGLGMLLFWGGLIFTAVFLVQRLFSPGSGMPPRQSQEKDPISILNERYARGEITRQQYERMKVDLQ